MQRKQEELQQTIVNQQDELRRVSEQLSVYQHRNLHQLQQPNQELPKTPGPSFQEAMQVDRDTLLHPSQAAHYQPYLLNIGTDQHMQHTPTHLSLDIENEPLSYMQLQPVHLMHIDTSLDSQQHQHVHPQHYANFLNRQRPAIRSSQYQTELASSSGNSTQEPDNRQPQDNSPYAMNSANPTQE